MIVVAIVLVLAVFFVLRFAIVVVPKDHVYVMERMGQYVATLNPGFHFVTPLMDTVRFKYPTTVQTEELSDVIETRDRVHLEDVMKRLGEAGYVAWLPGRR